MGKPCEGCVRKRYGCLPMKRVRRRLLRRTEVAGSCFEIRGSFASILGSRAWGFRSRRIAPCLV